MSEVERRCPTCGSPDPRLHPAMQFEGEVQICPNPFHPITEHTITDEMILELRQALGRERARIEQLLDETYTALFSAAEPDRTHARARCAEILNARRSRS